MAASSTGVGAVVAAAGGSSRMGDTDKLFAPLIGRPLLAHVLCAVHESRHVERVVLVVAAHNLERARQLVTEERLQKVSSVCLGGPRRQDSVRAGLEALGGCEWTLIHDGARLLIEPVIEAGLAAARETGAAVPATPIADTVKEVGKDDAAVARTLDRGRLRAAQTPQIFRYDLLIRAHREVTADVTDDAAMLEALDIPVKLFPGSPLNLKVTTPQDLRLAEALLRAHTGAATPGH